MKTKAEIIEILEDHLEWLHENEIIFKDEIPLIADTLLQDEQWISVDDRLPDEPYNESEYFPILIAEGSNGAVYEANYEGQGDFCTSMYGNYPTVTHWMPLPEPPISGLEPTQ